jgi:adenylate cyclase
MLKKILTGSALGLAAAVFVWLLANYVMRDILTSYEAKTYDWRVKQKLADVEPQSIDDIVIIDLDGRSLSKLGKVYQWPRSYYTHVINYLNEGGALLIGFDIIFDKDIWRPDLDELFVQAVQNAGNVYSALYLGGSDSTSFRYVMDKEPQQFNAEKFYYLLPPDDMDRFYSEERLDNEYFELLNASRGVGHVNFKADIDGVVRSIHLFSRFNEHLYPTLTFGMYLDAMGIDSMVVSSAKNNLLLYRQGELINGIPIDNHGNMKITYFGGFKTFRYVSFYDVLKKRIPKEYFENKIILLGTSLAGLYDLRSVPMQPSFPGVEIHANIMYTLLTQQYVNKISPFAAFLTIAGIGILLGIIISFLGPISSILFTLLFAVGYTFYAGYIFFTDNFWIEMVDPFIVMLFTFAGVYLYRFATEEKNKRFIRNTFSHFVTKSVVDELLANPDKIKLGGEKKVCTVFFSDVAGFTTISEQLTPEELVHLLNEYLTQMTNIVFDYNGMLDKYEGDAIMAVFGAPIAKGNHAYEACAASLEMQEKLVKMREFWKKQGRPQLTVRCGVNTGPMVVGNMGSETRFDYTVMGDAVNLGARLEPANKEYNTEIMIGHETYKMAGDLIYARQLDLLRVKGKTEPVKVYELMGIKEKGIKPEIEGVIEHFQLGFDNYLKQNWDEAIIQFNKVLKLNWDDGPSKRYIQRCELFKGSPPGDDWDGVWTMTTK